MTWNKSTIKIKPIHYMRTGALPIQKIKEMISAQMISGIQNDKQLQPASLDLSFSSEIYEVDHILLPVNGTKIRDLLPLMGARKVSIDDVCKVGCHYIVRINENFQLSPSIYGYANPKSSTGRVDVHVRLIADGHPQFDGIPHGYHGSVWASISPNSFNIKIYEGVSLNQARFFDGDTRFNQSDLEIWNTKYPLVWNMHDHQPVSLEKIGSMQHDGSVMLHVDFSSGDQAGWRAKNTDRLLDLSFLNHNPSEFWEPVYVTNGLLKLENNAFYILSTGEGVCIPPSVAAEISEMDARAGEFRAHYAGFVDPGFGWFADGVGCGNTVTLEIRPFTNIALQHGQAIARCKFELMSEIPDVIYGVKSSNYTKQSGPRLSKHFAM